jgi:hypothetical protein
MSDIDWLSQDKRKYKIDKLYNQSIPIYHAK